MRNVKLQLDSWRDAERRRDRLAPGSPAWQEADEDARTAAKAFHAEVAQASARYAEEDFQDRRPWSLPSDRRTSPAGRPVVDGHLARWPRG